MTQEAAPQDEALIGEGIPFRIHLLRAMNPITMWLLRSWLHFLASRDLLILRFRGRRTGRSFATPLSYVQIGNRLYLCTRPEVANWWKNLRGGTEVEIVWRGRATRASASVLDSTSEEAGEGFRAFLTRNPRTASMLYHVEAHSDGRPIEEDFSRELPRSIVVRLEPESAEPSR